MSIPSKEVEKPRHIETYSVEDCLAYLRGLLAEKPEIILDTTGICFAIQDQRKFGEPDNETPRNRIVIQVGPTTNFYSEKFEVTPNVLKLYDKGQFRSILDFAYHPSVQDVWYLKHSLPLERKEDLLRSIVEAVQHAVKWSKAQGEMIHEDHP